MHFAAFCGIEWSDYLQRMRDGVERHGPVRAGVYALAGYEGVEAHTPSSRTAQHRQLGQPTPHPNGEPPCDS